MLSDGCNIYSLELIIQDLIRKYNLQNGSETNRPIPATELINPILEVLNGATNAKSRGIGDIFSTCALCDAKKSAWVPKLMGWLKLHPSFTFIEYKVGLSGKDCAYQQLEETLIQLILNEGRNGIIPLPYFMNLLNRMFSTNKYDYELFSNCGFLKFEKEHGLPTKVLSSQSILAWIKADIESGILSAGDRKYVVILDEKAYGAANKRVQCDVQLRENAESDFLERSTEKLKGNEWLNYASPEANMDMPAKGPQEILRTVVSAASPICSDFQTFCPDWLHFGHFLCFGGIAASQLSLRIRPIYF